MQTTSYPIRSPQPARGVGFLVVGVLATFLTAAIVASLAASPSRPNVQPAPAGAGAAPIVRSDGWDRAHAAPHVGPQTGPVTPAARPIPHPRRNPPTRLIPR